MEPSKEIAAPAFSPQRVWLTARFHGEKNSVFERLRVRTVVRLLATSCADRANRPFDFVFDLTDDDLRRALYGPPAELGEGRLCDGFIGRRSTA